MNQIYNIAIYIARFFLKIIAHFNKKIDLFVSGRKETFNKIDTNILPNDQVIWFHCASLGEFEQGRPIIEKLKSLYPDYKIVLTFFSPSGYEVQKNYPLADVICYLPLDTKANAKRFLKSVHPKIAVFVKYEFWPNLLNELKNRNIETILISGIFRKNQIFFKARGTWMRKSLKAFTHFFVQNKESKKLLKQIGLDHITISGDTRFDRVYQIIKMDNQLSFIEDFIQNKYTLVAGSTWPEDEEILVDYINNSSSDHEKFIIAPHNISDKIIRELQNSIHKKSILFSDEEKDNTAQVFIVDTVGILTKIYSYADASYIGGGFGSEGVHNVLEPATFGMPLVIGPIYYQFQEAVDLVNLKACEVVNNKEELGLYLSKLFNNLDYRKEKGELTKQYINSNIGATEIILEYISHKFSDIL